ncbi:LysR family transcriptional regulator [Oricola sp.]|uniref:LysR family transcriptional regulator n=1 Tax=Oricola sp. TaxID=1979950 RepID=UPI003BAD8CB1
MPLDWDDLRYFLATARTGRLTAASRRMGTDHATVSRRITALENALGAILFTRSPRGYALTDAGERLLRHAENMESSAAAMHADIADEKFALSGTVRVGSPDGFGAYFLAPRIGKLLERHSGLAVEIVAMPRVFSLSRREADIAIGLERPVRGRLFSRKLTDYTLHLYAARDYLAAREPITGKADLARHPVIGYIPDLLFTPELDYLGAVTENQPARLTSSNLMAQMQATEAGAGLCILPDFMARQSPGLEPVLADEIELKRTYWIMAHLDYRESARVQTVIGFILDRIREDRQMF